MSYHSNDATTRAFLLGWATGLATAAGVAVLVGLGLMLSGCYRGESPSVAAPAPTPTQASADCPTVPPRPPAPDVRCGEVPFDDCRALTDAAWSRYDAQVAEWERLYGRPCQPASCSTLVLATLTAKVTLILRDPGAPDASLTLDEERCIGALLGVRQ